MSNSGSAPLTASADDKVRRFVNKICKNVPRAIGVAVLANLDELVQGRTPFPLKNVFRLTGQEHRFSPHFSVSKHS